MVDAKLLLPLQIGHESELLDPPPLNGHTHKWTVFVRSAGPAQFTDRSFISKVVFKLHPDFANPRRIIKEPPFEVTETGYAGFMIPIFVTFTGTVKQYKLFYDMNLSFEKQSKHSVEQLLQIEQPSRDFYEMILKYGGRVKTEKKKKEKQQLQQDIEEYERSPDRNEFEEKQKKRKKKSYDGESKPEIFKEVIKTADYKAMGPTTSAASAPAPARNHTPRKAQKPFSDEGEKAEKLKNVASSSRSTPPSERSKGSSSGRVTPLNDRPKALTNGKASPMKERPKSAINGRSTPLLEVPKSSNRSSPLIERQKCSANGTPPVERPKSSTNGKLNSPNDYSKLSSDDQQPPVKRPKVEVSIDTLQSLQRNLMSMTDPDKVLEIVDTIFASSQSLVPSMEFSEETNLLSFDLFSLDPGLIAKLEELCH